MFSDSTHLGPHFHGGVRFVIDPQSSAIEPWHFPRKKPSSDLGVTGYPGYGNPHVPRRHPRRLFVVAQTNEGAILRHEWWKSRCDSGDRGPMIRIGDHQY